MVVRIRSGLTQAASTGPSHSRMAGMVRPLDFWLWVGPRAITAWSGWAATRRPFTRAGVPRPGGRPPHVQPRERRGGAPAGRPDLVVRGAGPLDHDGPAHAAPG